MNYGNEPNFVIWNHYGISNEESYLRLVMRLLAFAYAIGNKIGVDFTKVDENGDICGAVLIVSCDDIAHKE